MESLSFLVTLVNLLAWTTLVSVLVTIFLWTTGMERRLVRLEKWSGTKPMSLLTGAVLVLLGTLFFLFSLVEPTCPLGVEPMCYDIRRGHVLSSWFFGALSFGIALVVLFIGGTDGESRLRAVAAPGP